MGGDDDMMTMMMEDPMLMKGEEYPTFREGAQKSMRPPANMKMMPMMMMKPHYHKMMRDDSAASTVDTSSEFSPSGTMALHSSKEVLVQVKEHASDGDWLCQLQYRLYSREEEEAILLRSYLQSRRPTSSFRRASGNVTGEICLISGAAGVGKTRLARTLAIPVQEENGYFLSAKFDQVRQARPIRIFADAFTEFTHAVLAQGPDVVEATKQNICEALGDELTVLLSGIPVLERIVGKPDGEPIQMNCQMAKRFIFALQDLIGAVCTAICPMVILLDDLQWADPCSLKLLKTFISCNQNRHLYIVGTCDDTVGPHTPLSGMLRDLEDESHRQIFHIKVAQKPCYVVKQMITEAIPMPKERHDVLAKLVCGQTQGNPLYILEFLRWLSDEKLLEYDAAEGTFTLHDSDVRLAINSCRLGDFLVDKMEHLPRQLQEVLRVAACFGNELNEDLLKTVFPADSLADHLHDATSRGVLIFDGDSGYSFRHDGLQNAALALIPAEEKEALHLRLGRKMLKGLGEEKREKHMYLILGQLRMGRELIKETREKEAVAMLCLTAGQAAARASAFGAAAFYFEFGIDMTEDFGWHGDYSLKLALHNAAAEMELTVSNYERVHELVQVVLLHVPKLRHKIQAYNTLIYAYGVTDKQHLAVETGIQVLAELGETFPTKNCMAALRSEISKVRRLLKGKSNAQIMRMERIKDEDKLAALQILNIMFMNAAMARPRFAPFIQLKSVEITMKYGLSALASNAFASYGMLCTAIGRYDESFRHGQLALDLLKEFRSKEYLPRVFATVYGFIIPFQRPIRETICPLKKAQEVGSQTGDIEFALMSACLYSGTLFYTNGLQEVSNLIENVINMMATRRQDSMLVMIKPFYQLTQNLMGLTEDPLTFSLETELTEAFKHAEETNNATSIVCIRLQKMMLKYIFGDYGQAAKLVAEIEGLNLPTLGFDSVFIKFFIGMTQLATARTSKGLQRFKCLQKVRKAIKDFKIWSLHAPHNCLPMKYLLEAELASFQGRNKKAYEKYTAATALAIDAGFQMVEAMSHEQAGKHLFSIGNENLARASFKKALASYEKWGAKAKLRYLEDEVQEMFSTTSVQFDQSERLSHHF